MELYLYQTKKSLFKIIKTHHVKILKILENDCIKRELNRRGRVRTTETLLYEEDESCDLIGQ